MLWRLGLISGQVPAFEASVLITSTSHAFLHADGLTFSWNLPVRCTPGGLIKIGYKGPKPVSEENAWTKYRGWEELWPCSISLGSTTCTFQASPQNLEKGEMLCSFKGHFNPFIQRHFELINVPSFVSLIVLPKSIYNASWIPPGPWSISWPTLVQNMTHPDLSRASTTPLGILRGEDHVRKWSTVFSHSVIWKNLGLQNLTVDIYWENLIWEYSKIVFTNHKSV